MSGRPRYLFEHNSVKLLALLRGLRKTQASDRYLATLLGTSSRSISRYVAWLVVQGYVELAHSKRFVGPGWINTRTITCKTGEHNGVHED